MKKVDFSFIRGAVLQKNIESVYGDTLKLMAMIMYTESQVEHCLRKTIIIYTASVIEALLLWKIREYLGAEKVILHNEWRYRDPRLIHTADDYEIIWAKRNREERDVEKLDFNRMITLCKNKRILKENVLEKLDEVRKPEKQDSYRRIKNGYKNIPKKGCGSHYRSAGKYPTDNQIANRCIQFNTSLIVPLCLMVWQRDATSVCTQQETPCGVSCRPRLSPHFFTHR